MPCRWFDFLPISRRRNGPKWLVESCLLRVRFSIATRLFMRQVGLSGELSRLSVIWSSETFKMAQLRLSVHARYRRHRACSLLGAEVPQNTMPSIPGQRGELKMVH